MCWLPNDCVWSVTAGGPSNRVVRVGMGLPWRGAWLWCVRVSIFITDSNSVGGCPLLSMCTTVARGGSCKSARAITPPVLERPAHVAVSHGCLTWLSHRTAVSASGGFGWSARLAGSAGDTRGRDTVA